MGKNSILIYVNIIRCLLLYQPEVLVTSMVYVRESRTMLAIYANFGNILLPLRVPEMTIPVYFLGSLDADQIAKKALLNGHYRRNAALYDCVKGRPSRSRSAHSQCTFSSCSSGKAVITVTEACSLKGRKGHLQGRCPV